MFQNIKNFFKSLRMGFDSLDKGFESLFNVASTFTLFPDVELMPLDDEVKANEIRVRRGLKPYPFTGEKGLEKDSQNIRKDFEKILGKL